MNDFNPSGFPGPRRGSAGRPLRARVEDVDSAGSPPRHEPSHGPAHNTGLFAGHDTRHDAGRDAPAPTEPTQAAKRRRSTGAGLAGMVLGAVAVVGALLYFGGEHLAGTGGSASGEGGRIGVSDRTYSYYHDSYYDSDSYSSRWEKDGSFEREKTWNYKGAYDYEGYGSAGMRDRARGKATDPLLTETDDGPGVFERYGLSSDPTAGEPIGDPWASMLDPTYSPYAGYSNPYANRIRMSTGQGRGRGAYLEY